MFCDRILGNRVDWADLEDGGEGSVEPAPPPAAPPTLDWLDLDWHACRRRAFQSESRRGLAVRLLLPVGSVLRHGDLLCDRKDRQLVIRIRPCPLLNVHTPSPREAALAALELGNLHVPVEIGENRLLTPPDGPSQGVLDKHGLSYDVVRARFHPQTIWGVSWAVAPGGPTIVPTAPPGSRTR